MEQFIQYLYEYRAGQPERNVGFIRVNPGKDRTVIQIHGKGLQLGRQSELQLYIFYLENETPVGIYQGTIGNINPAINYRLTYTAEDTGIPENYPRIQGLLLDFEGKRRFAADWSGHEGLGTGAYGESRAGA
jgi:hypothetical protein